MAAVKSNGPYGPQYVVVDPRGFSLTLRPGSGGFVHLAESGFDLRLSQQNVTDLIVALQGFSNTGVLT